jgi:hypothetical protein
MRCLSCGLLVALTMVLVGASEAWACPMCKLALETDDPQPRAYMISILFMLGMIGSMFAGVTGLLIWLSRRERLVLEGAGYQHLFENGVNNSFPESHR